MSRRWLRRDALEALATVSLIAAAVVGLLYQWDTSAVSVAMAYSDAFSAELVSLAR